MRLPTIFLTLLLTALPLPAPTAALHESEVGVVDWHKPLVGVPLIGSPNTAPLFHRVSVGQGVTKSVVVTATESNVLAAIDPVDGTVAWRHVFDAEDPIALFKKHKDVIATLSGPGGSTLRTFDVLTGHLLFEKRLHAPHTGTLFEPGDLGLGIAFVPGSTPSENEQLLVLTNGHTLRRVDARTGEVVWSWMSEDQSSLIIYTRIIPTSSTTYLIGLAKSVKSYTLHATTLSSQSGTLIASRNIPSSLSPASTSTPPSSAFLALSLFPSPNTNTATPSSHDTPPRLLWLEQKTLHTLPLSPSLSHIKPGAYKGVAYKELVDVGLAEGYGMFVAVLEDGSGKVIGVSGEGKGEEGAVKGLWEFSESADSPRYTPSIYAGGLDKDGYPYVSRIYWSHVLQKSSIHTYAPHLAEGKGLVTGITLPFDTNMHGIIAHAAIDTANPSPYTVLTRAVLTTSTGAVQLWQQDKAQWTREEALAEIVVAEFVELPEGMSVGAEVDLGGEEGFVGRVARQVLDAKDFPQYLVNFIKRFATGSYASTSTSIPPTDTNTTTGPLTRDAFGFRQMLVVATPRGKVYGLDSSSGRIVWSRVLGHGWAAEIGATVLPVKLFVTRRVGDVDVSGGGDAGGPQVVLVTQRKAENTLVDTVIFHIDAMTGEDVRKVAPSGDIFQGLDIISGPIVEAFLLQRNTKTVLLLDEFMQVYLYPDTEANKADLEAASPSLYFPVRTGGPGKRQLMGHQLLLNPELSSRFVGHPTWTFSLPTNEEIQTIIPSRRGPIASIGKVLGNRSTLYKYLNPHLMTLTTSSLTSHPPMCAIYVVDAAKGSIVYHATLPTSAGVCDVKATITENWLVYSYFDEDFAGVGQSKGHRIVSVEFYEGVKPDDKVKSSDMSSFSNRTTEVTAYEQSYVTPYGIETLTTTSTKFGVTAKDIILATTNSKIQSLPRRFLDPRRPNRKLTNEDVEEQLIQYEPVLQDHPQRVLSHSYEVGNVRRIVTAPALLESTSLVFAYGLDLFLTRVSPSGTFDVLNENFNKAQLVLTIVALAVAIVITKPMVQRKRLRERWYQ